MEESWSPRSRQFAAKWKRERSQGKEEEEEEEMKLGDDQEQGDQADDRETIWEAIVRRVPAAEVEEVRRAVGARVIETNQDIASEIRTLREILEELHEDHEKGLQARTHMERNPLPRSSARKFLEEQILLLLNYIKDRDVKSSSSVAQTARGRNGEKPDPVAFLYRIATTVRSKGTATAAAAATTLGTPRTLTRRQRAVVDYVAEQEQLRSASGNRNNKNSSNRNNNDNSNNNNKNNNTDIERGNDSKGPCAKHWDINGGHVAAHKQRPSTGQARPRSATSISGRQTVSSAPPAENILRTLHEQLNVFRIDGIVDQLRTVLEEEKKELLEQVEYLQMSLELQHEENEQQEYRTRPPDLEELRECSRDLERTWLSAGDVEALRNAPTIKQRHSPLNRRQHSNCFQEKQQQHQQQQQEVATNQRVGAEHPDPPGRSRSKAASRLRDTVWSSRMT